MSQRQEDDSVDSASDALAEELHRIINFHIREYSISFASLVGTIELVKAAVISEWLEGEEVENEE